LNPSQQICVIGAGVVGLSIARELAGRGQIVAIVDRGRAGSGASGAAVGVLQAPNWKRNAFAQLLREGALRYEEIAAELLAETGIDILYRRCGCIFIHNERPSHPEREVDRWRDAGVHSEWHELDGIRSIIPGFGGAARFGLAVDDEAILRPALLLDALRASCLARGVSIVEDAGDTRLVSDPSRCVRLESPSSTGISEDSLFVVTAGSWSPTVTEALPEFTLPIDPVRGQAIAVRGPSPSRVVRIRLGGVGEAYYIVPQEKDSFWVGSTLEEDGSFSTETTEEGLDELLVAAREVYPQLERGDVLRHWCGLRPKAMRRGGLFLGRWPNLDNVWIASGNYRTGVSQAPGVARILADALIANDDSEIPADFSLSREE